MRLKDWLEENDRTQGEFGDALGISQQSVSNYCRDWFDPLFVDPPVAVKHKIWHATGGRVAPNDFYGLPPQAPAIMRYEDIYPNFCPPPTWPAVGGGREDERVRPGHTKGLCVAGGATGGRVGNPDRSLGNRKEA